LFLATLLQKFMVLAHGEAAVLLAGRHALVSQPTALAVAFAPLETVGDLHAAGLLAACQPAAMAALLTGQAAGLSMRNIDLEGFDRQAIHPGPTRAGLIYNRGLPRSLSIPRVDAGRTRS
jgi:hypothetical protein